MTLETLKVKAPYGLEIEPGWYQLVVDLDDKLTALIPDYEINQIKEKFGGLRYYVTWPDDCDQTTVAQADSLIDEAEGLSWKICEACGATEGVVTRAPASRKFGWIRTQCAACWVIADVPRKL